MKHVTRLEALCELHRQQGGTIHDFNSQYKINFLNLTDQEFKEFCQYYTDMEYAINRMIAAAAIKAGKVHVLFSEKEAKRGEK